MTAPFFFATLLFMSIKVSLNHIGIATEQGNPQLEKLFRLLHLTRGISEKVEEQGVNVHFFNLEGQPPHLELLEVMDPEGAVAKFIAKRGPGIHHLSFQVESGGLDGLCERLKSEGFRFTYDQPKRGAQNMRINFIHPATAGGVLIELMEAQNAH
jgi:methylmalonyl-CoA/ethylmalonyl-CoA epimerase